ncbi:hypothetical protein NOF04DRAFT_1308728, partial [Fusarium oxysporum II5]
MTPPTHTDIGALLFCSMYCFYTALYEHTRSNPDSKAFSFHLDGFVLFFLFLFIIYSKGVWDWTVSQVYEWLHGWFSPYKAHGLD